MEEITQQLWEASEKKRVCRIQMRGEPLNRVVHPYGICQTSANKITLVCWQALGFTNSRGEPGYRNLILEDCESVEGPDNNTGCFGGDDTHLTAELILLVLFPLAHTLGVRLM